MEQLTRDGSVPYNAVDARVDLEEAMDHLWTIERRAADHADVRGNVRAARQKIERVQRWVERGDVEVDE